MLPLRCPRGWARPHKHPPTRFTELAERILLFAGIICKSGSLYVELYNKSLLLLNWPSDSQRQSYRAFFMFWMIYPCFTCPPLLCESRDLDTAVLFPVLVSKQPKPNNFRLYFSLHPLCFLPTHGWKALSLHRALNTLPKEMWERYSPYVFWH